MEEVKLIEALKREVDKKKFGHLHLAVLYYNLFQLYNKSNQYELAESTLGELIKLDPNDIEYKYDYIRFLFKLNRDDEAKVVLDNLTEQGDKVFQNNYYAQYFGKKKKYNEARRYAEKALIYNYNLQKNNQFLYNYLVYCLKSDEPFKNRYLEEFIDLQEPLAQEIQKIVGIRGENY